MIPCLPRVYALVFPKLLSWGRRDWSGVCRRDFPSWSNWLQLRWMLQLCDSVVSIVRLGTNGSAYCLWSTCCSAVWLTVIGSTRRVWKYHLLYFAHSAFMSCFPFLLFHCLSLSMTCILSLPHYVFIVPIRSPLEPLLTLLPPKLLISNLQMWKGKKERHDLVKLPK